MDDTVIELDNVNKSFRVHTDRPQTMKERLIFFKNNKVEKKEVIKNISLDIHRGETVCLIGVNGCGKSTLLKLMTKILYPTSGSIKTRGKLTSLLELGAGFHPDFTGRENIYFNAAVFGLNRAEIDSRLEDIIEFSELEKEIDTPVRTYSSGMYMRLAFSIAINVDADILLIDEILAVGDQHFQDKCFAKLEELRDSDKTIVIVSHSLDTMRTICERGIWVRDGEVAEDGDANTVINHYLDYVALVYDDDFEYVEKENYDGILNVDTPIQGVTLENEKEIHIVGWELSDDIYSEVIVSINNKSIDGMKRMPRGDVLLTYEGMYGGSSLNRTAGWMISAPFSLFVEGINTIRIDLKDGKGKTIAFEERIVYKKKGEDLDEGNHS